MKLRLAMALSMGPLTVHSASAQFARDSAVYAGTGTVFSNEIQNLSSTLQSAMIAALMTSVIVYCVIELIKPAMRPYFNNLVFMLWRQRRAKSLSGVVHSPSVSLPFDRATFPLHFSSYFLPPDLFLKQLENRARAAMEGGPGDELPLFAAGAPEKDIREIMSRSRLGPAIEEPQVGAAETKQSQIAAAETNVAGAI